MMIVDLLDRIKDYEGIRTTEYFKHMLTPELQSELKELIAQNPDWEEKAEKQDVYFIIYDCRWKSPGISSWKIKARLKLVGAEEAPTIALDYQY